MKRYQLIMLIMISLISSCVSSSQVGFRPREINVPGTYIHQASEIQCPNNINYFSRVSILQYDPSGFDVSCGYNALIHSELMTITVYIYPMAKEGNIQDSEKPGALKRHFDQYLNSIAYNASNYKLLRSSEVSLDQEELKGDGWEAEFKYMINFSHKNQLVDSHFKLFYIDNWFIKYRISYPENAFDNSKEIIDLFMQDFKITGY